MSVDVTLLLLHVLRPTTTDRAVTGAARERISALLPIMAGFVAGTTVGAVGYAVTGFWTLMVPLALAYAVCGWAFRAADKVAAS